jgi:hypothetical protein
MMTFLIALAMVPCNSHWPSGEQPAAPQNVIVWSSMAAARESGVLDMERQRDGDAVRLRAIEGRTFTRSGVIWQAFEADNIIVAPGCYDTPESMFALCVGETTDDEEPIDPVITAEISPKSYGTPVNNDPRIFEAARPDLPASTCFGGGDQTGNLSITIEADESQPLIALVTVKEDGNTLREEGIFMQGQQRIKLDVAIQTKATIEARFIDQAGQLGELASIEVTPPPSSCSHTSLSLLMLFALFGLRRRLA